MIEIEKSLGIHTIVPKDQYGYPQEQILESILRHGLFGREGFACLTSSLVRYFALCSPQPIDVVFLTPNVPTEEISTDNYKSGNLYRDLVIETSKDQVPTLVLQLYPEVDQFVTAPPDDILGIVYWNSLDERINATTEIRFATRSAVKGFRVGELTVLERICEALKEGKVVLINCEDTTSLLEMIAESCLETANKQEARTPLWLRELFYF